MNEKITNLSPNSSQNFYEHKHDEENWMSKIDAQIRGDPQFFLPPQGPGPQFHEDPLWTERKENKKKKNVNWSAYSAREVTTLTGNLGSHVGGDGIRNPNRTGQMV